MSVIQPPAALPLQPFGRPPSAGAFAYASLREAILTLALPPGAVLSRAALAAQLGLSQTPVREALMRLEAEGLVEVVPSASTRVAPIDLTSARRAQFLRRAVELEMVQALAAAPPATLGEVLAGHLARQAELVAREDHAGLTAADDAFHEALHEAAGISPLWAMVRSRSGHLDRLRRLHLPAPGKAETILREHEAIAGAILAGDGAGAAMALRRHLADTLGRVETLRAAQPGHFTGA
ncbi:GntR family transcriptional regulator [Teichococcus aestuarii]|uniref:GntR family transcriptional regulator n=1 Tax=Teichococcus aestuarii TaxID=568898 RepID=UPI00360F1B62